MFQAPPQQRDPVDNYIHTKIIPSLESKLGIKVPLNDPNFSFMGYLRGLFIKSGYKGFGLEEKINETLQRLLIGNTPGEWGPVVSRYNGSTPFDLFFAMAAKRRKNSELRDDKLKRDNLPVVNIKPSGGDEVGGGISEDTLGEEDSGEAIAEADYETTYKDIVFYLKRARYGELLSYIFHLMSPEPQGLGMAIPEMVDHLTTEGIKSPSGQSKWSSGMLNGYVTQIRKVVQDYMRDDAFSKANQGVPEDALINKFKERKNVYEEGFKQEDVKNGLLTQEEAKPVARHYWNKGGERIPFTVIRKSLKNWSARLEDGTKVTIPVSQIER
jgi:hypothetical protein